MGTEGRTMTIEDLDSESWTWMADALDPIAPASEARERLVKQIRGPQRYAPFAGEIAETFGVDRDGTLAALARVDEPEAWRPGFIPGSRILKLDGGPKTRVMLARLAAGASVLRHRHATRERIYVIQGMLREDGERTFGPGDLLDKAPGTEHELLAAGGAECLVVLAEDRG